MKRQERLRVGSGKETQSLLTEQIIDLPLYIHSSCPPAPSHNSSLFLPLPFLPIFLLTLPFICQERSRAIQILLSSFLRWSDLVGVWQLRSSVICHSKCFNWKALGFHVFHFELTVTEQSVGTVVSF